MVNENRARNKGGGGNGVRMEKVESCSISSVVENEIKEFSFSF